MKKLLVILAFTVFSVEGQAQEETNYHEQTVLQLNRVNDILAILQEIKLRSAQLSTEELHYYLATTLSKKELEALFPTVQEPLAVTDKKVDVKTNPNRPNKSKPKPKKSPQGLVGLTVAHAQSARPEIGYAASAILVSHGRAIPCAIGQEFTHNNEKFKVISIDKSTGGARAHIVTIESIKTKRKSILPWKTV